MKKVSAQTFQSISFFCVAIVTGLLPFAFLPNTLAPSGAVKGVLLYGGVFLALALWLIAQFSKGTIEVPKHRVLLGLGVWTLLTLLSALFSKNIGVSLWGRGFALDSFATTFVLSVLAFLVATYTTEQRKLVQFFLILFSSAAVTLFLQIILFLFHNSGFIAHSLSLVAYNGSLVGSWLDFGQYTVLIFLLALLTFEVLSPRGFLKTASLILVLVSLLVLVFLNSVSIWIITLGATMLIFVYKSSVERVLSRAPGETLPAVEHVPFPWLTFASLLIGLFFVLSSNSVGAAVARLGGLNAQNIRPSIATSAQIIRGSFLKDPIFGAGPGRFENAWNLYHPQNINNTVFWNTSFENGYSSLFTSEVSRGTLATIALLLTFYFALLYGFRLFAYHFKDQFGRFLGASTLILLITTITFFVISTPNILVLAFLFIYLGVFVGLGVSVGVNRTISIRFLQDPRQSFFAIFILAICILAAVGAGYTSIKRFASVISFNRALAASNTETALRRLQNAISLSNNDLYYRTVTSVHSLTFTSEANQGQNADKTKLQNAFSAAEQNANAAVAWDPTSPANWYTLGQVYQLVLSSTPEAAGNALSAFTKASEFAPKNPLFLLSKAQIAIAQKDTDTAQSLITQAKALKPNYLDAYLFEAQLKQASGDQSGARDIIKSYTQVAPYDAQGFGVLGIAERNLKNYDNAIAAFKQAKSLSPGAINYEVLLIQTYYTKGDTAGAEAEKAVAKTLFPNAATAIDGIKPVVNPTPLPEATKTETGGEKKTP